MLDFEQTADIGNVFQMGRPELVSSLVSWIKPPSTTVAPSFSDSCVATFRLLIVGLWMPPVLVLATLLTSCVISRST